MSETNEKVITKRLKSVKRGAYWFGMVGRISIYFGLLYLILVLIEVVFKAGFSVVEERLEDSVRALIYGGLFLLGRNAFDAIAYLIEERKDTV
jgi:hypothetical protein